MNKEDLILEELQKLNEKLDAMEERQKEIKSKVDRLFAWVEKVVDNIKTKS